MSAQHSKASGRGCAAKVAAYNALREAGAGPTGAFNGAFRAQATRVLPWVIFILMGSLMLLAAWMAAQEGLGA